jgi:hypothetical protein
MALDGVLDHAHVPGHKSRIWAIRADIQTAETKTPPEGGVL